jgi:hypothetical protein
MKKVVVRVTFDMVHDAEKHITEAKENWRHCKMTYKELQEKIARLETELTEVKEKIAALPKRADGVFKPQDGQKYWFISGAGGVYEGWWNDHQVDHNRYAIGNCFPNKQAAKDVVRALKLTQKARETQNGFVPDWENGEQNKYFLDFHMGGIRIMYHVSRNIAPIFGFWEGESACEQFIDENEKDLLWFFTEYRR